MSSQFILFFFNDTATTEIYTLSLTRRSSDLGWAFEHGFLFSTYYGSAAMPIEVALALRGPDHQLPFRSEEHTSELQSRLHLVCRLLLEKKKASCQAVYIAPLSQRVYHGACPA